MKKKARVLPQEIAKLILSEPDFLEANEFFAKADVWYKVIQENR